MRAEASRRIRPATASDGPALAALYNHYIVHTPITFEEVEVSGTEMATRVADVHAGGFPWLVATRDASLVGYAYAAPWRTRSAYRYSVEVTVYVLHQHPRRGIGTALYEALFADLRTRGVHAVMGGITLPNDASVALHERFGMTKVAHFAQVGFKFGTWHDVGYWHRLL
jgi:L-amino acid N-acyltransferase YncA